MSITAAQKHIIDCVVSINETGKLPSNKAYSTVTVLADKAGITFGKHQATRKSLYLIVLKYIEMEGRDAKLLTPYLDKLKSNASVDADPNKLPKDVKDLMAILATAGSDPLMHEAQDAIFDSEYFEPAVAKGEAMGLVTGMAYLSLYDVAIQSGPARIDALRKLFPESPPSKGGLEKAWVMAFLSARKAWLQTSSNPLVVASAGRVEAMIQLAKSGNWNLEPGFKYRGVVVS